jgi:uncharacterized membrane protein (DUF4010 family)
VTPRETLLSLAVTLAAGLLVGAERERAHVKVKGDFGGIRTFPLIALLGAIGALLSEERGWLLGAFLLGVVAILVLSRTGNGEEERGITSEVAAIVTFGLGALACSPKLLEQGPRLLLVIGLSAVTMALLAVKAPLHGFIARVSRDDVYATAKFVVLALVLLPLLPNRAYGPLEVLNPYKIGLFVVLVAAVGFAGYVAARLVGSGRGLLLVGLIGGLVSSTAVTVTLSGRAKGEPKLVPPAAVAILGACSAMFVRVLVVVGIADVALFPRLAGPLGAMALTSAGIAFFMVRGASGKGKSGEGVSFRNPFELKSALAFGLLYALILFVAKAASVYVGPSGLYASALVSGLADVDAITLSLTELHRAGTSGSVAVTGIVLAVATNTLVKAVIAALLGGRALGARVLVAMLGVLAAGGVGLLAGVVLE